MTELDRYKAALGLAVGTLQVVQSRAPVIVASALDAIKQCLNPQPEMETVNVERWSWGSGHSTFSTEDAAIKDADGCGVAYRLSGTYQRPKPQPVERSVSVRGAISHGGMIQVDSLRTANAPDCGCLGKTGTITFTWTE